MNIIISAIFSNGRIFLSSPTILLFFILLFQSSCGNRFVRNKEARDDAREMELAVASNMKIKNSISAQVETDPVYAVNVDNDTADDPAIWYNDVKPEASIIFGSNKKHGIHSYNLKGEEVQYVPCGTINNIDVRKAINFSGGKYDVLAGSHRFNNSIVLFTIDQNGIIKSTPDFEIGLPDFDPYGFCLYKNEKGKLYAFINNKNGEIYQVSIDIDPNGFLKSDVENQFKLKTQVEGMVVDDEYGKLFVGEEQSGIYLFDLKAKNIKGQLLKGSTNANRNIRYDVEGLALINSKFLIASSQGNFSYAIYNLDSESYITSFKIIDGSNDAVEETDGLEVSTLPFGQLFPKGILVVQDGFNYDGKVKKAQNFKIVDLREVDKFLDK